MFAVWPVLFTFVLTHIKTGGVFVHAEAEPSYCQILKS